MIGLPEPLEMPPPPADEAELLLKVLLGMVGLPEALESFRKAGESDPQDADYRFNQGYALWKAGEFDPAAEMFRASLNLAPADSEAILMLGRCLKRTAVRDTEQRVTGLERIKPSLKEAAYLNLRAARGRRAR